jgi:hypothetical protein
MQWQTVADAKKKDKLERECVGASVAYDDEHDDRIVIRVLDNDRRCWPRCLNEAPSAGFYSRYCLAP